MQRIRITLLIPDGNRILFVRESAEPGLFAVAVGPDDETIWQLPGDGLEPGESIYDCAAREAREETGLNVEPQRIAYLREFIDPARPFHEIAIWVLARAIGGTLAVPANDHVIELRYLSRADVGRVNVVHWHSHPAIWEDLSSGFPEFRHLGVEQADGEIRTVTSTFPQ